MCVGLPARVEKIQNGTALINASGVRREISVELIRNLHPGDYVMIHAGIAIAKITAEEAEETAAVMEELYANRL